MTYKEKVTALLESKELTKEQKEKLEGIFPELAESEDDRIRNNCIEYIKASCLDIDELNECIVWFEKQGEHAKFRDSIQVGDKVTRNQDGMLVNLSQLNRVAKKDEKQNEQNPDNIDNKFISMRETKPKDISEFLDRLTTVEQEFLWEHIAKIRELDKEEQKPAGWHREDEQNLNACLGYIPDEFLRRWLTDVIHTKYDKPTDKVEPKFKIKYAGSEYNVLEVKDIAGVTYYGIEDEPNHIDYVLPDNCEIISEQKSSWSEEDESKRKFIKDELLGLIADEIDIKLPLTKRAKDLYSALCWLKSLRPQSTWKPSEEMLEALYRVIPENTMEISEDEMLLDKLYQGLKYGKVLNEK